ncbi:hypothetical protein CL657_02100 [bacterium]|nr:hypothetical protein [bacterium]|tara:strand:+ start:331 stop:669 length:339 start_codon:yes stop_codon:yes gene_type:complete
MIIKTDDYIIDSSILNEVSISGSMRLPSPLSYDQPFSLIKKSLENCTDTLTVNLTSLEYLNSSGITSLARIIIQARKDNKDMKLIINNSIPWQQKTLLSLKQLWEKLDIESI